MVGPVARAEETGRGTGRRPGFPLPGSLEREMAANPWPVLSERARKILRRKTPALADRVDEYPDAVFGLTSGFFHLPVAQARAWGLADDGLCTEFHTLLALMHFHYAFQDLVVDEGEAPPVMCLLSESCLLAYLDGISALAPGEYRTLHTDYYALYTAAIAADLSHRVQLRAYSPDEIVGLGRKAAPVATALHVAADLSGKACDASAAAQALLLLCTGLQLLDDLTDCARDAAVGNMTWPVTSAFLAYPGLDAADAGAVEAGVLACGAAEGSARLAADVFGRAADRAAACGADVLSDLSLVWVRRARRRLEDVRQSIRNAR
jgi:hypothetical protein